jgi:hypothetical protein
VAVKSSATPVTEPVQQAATAEQSSTPAPSPAIPAPMTTPITTNIPSADAGTSSGVFDKPSPFASAPAPEPSAPTEAAKPAPYKPPAAALGSAPIPARDSILDDDSIPPLPAIDIELTDSFPLPEDLPAEMLAELPEELPDGPEIPYDPNFEATMVIAPDESLSTKPSGNSTEAFIERVKGQLSKAPGQNEVEPFSSTVPQ